jgi:nicotinamide-nucleotide adenylyltransferase
MDGSAQHTTATTRRLYYKGTVALEFFHRAAGEPQALGILPAAFNPPTRAHLALAGAALHIVDEVLFVLPREFPHKSYVHASFDQRRDMLLAATVGERQYSVAASTRGLFVEIAEECREAYGESARLMFICGRDAAERIIGWDYGHAGGFLRMLDRFELLVAPRLGDLRLLPEMQGGRIQLLSVPEDLSVVSATAVRERIRRGEPWEDLVPPEIVRLVRRIYGG